MAMVNHIENSSSLINYNHTFTLKPMLSSNNSNNETEILGDIFCSGLESNSNHFTSFLICGLLTLIVNSLGILGNILSLCILSTSFAKVSILIYLICLSVCDTIMLSVDIGCFVLPVIFEYLQIFHYYTNVLIPSIAPFAYPFADFGITGSAYFTVAITIDRYIVVCWPLEAKSSCTMKRARYSSIIILILSFLYNLPRFWEYTTTIVKSSTTTTNSSLNPMYQVKVTEFGASLMYKQWYLLFSWFIFIFIIPFIILFILNTLICRKVHEANKTRRNLSGALVHHDSNNSSSNYSSASKNSLSITYMSVCLVVVFLACNIPFFINRIIQEFLTLTPIPFIVFTSNILTSVNSSVNWIIYCLFGKKFRVEFFKLLSRPCCFSSCFIKICAKFYINHNNNSSGVGARTRGISETNQATNNCTDNNKFDNENNVSIVVINNN